MGDRRELFIVYKARNGSEVSEGRQTVSVPSATFSNDRLTFAQIEAIEQAALAERVRGGNPTDQLFLTWWQWLADEEPAA